MFHMALPFWRSLLYRCFDAEGRLLYLGKSRYFLSRLETHRQTSPWWHEVAKITTETVPDDQLDEAEREAIRRERPLYNLSVRVRQEWRTRGSLSPSA